MSGDHAVNVIELSAADVRTLTINELQARGLSEAAAAWIVAHREAGAVRFHPHTSTIQPIEEGQ